jgi:hypothetical protein
VGFASSPVENIREFNRFLDRGVVVGDINNRSLGFLPMRRKHNKATIVLRFRLIQPINTADVKVTIEVILDQLPESYPTDVYQRKCEEVYQHVYESYSGAGRSIYNTAA